MSWITAEIFGIGITDSTRTSLSDSSSSSTGAGSDSSSRTNDNIIQTFLFLFFCQYKHRPRYCSSISISFHVHSVWILILKNDRHYFRSISLCLSYVVDFFSVFFRCGGMEFWLSRFFDTVGDFPVVVIVVVVRAKTSFCSSPDTPNADPFSGKNKINKYISFRCFFFS